MTISSTATPGWRPSSRLSRRNWASPPARTSNDGAVSLDVTPCIGMCDQAPAAMINDVILTALTPGKARTIARALREGQCPESLISPDFDGLDAVRNAQQPPSPTKSVWRRLAPRPRPL